MRALSIRNPDLSGQERSYLTSAYTTGGTSLTITNNFAFAADDIIVSEQPGVEKAESKKVSSISGNTTLNLDSTLKFSHPQNTVIIKTPWDQIEISRTLTATISWSVISTSGIQWDKPYTVYVDSTGDSTYSYRWRFKNSVSNLYSEYSPTYGGTGFTRDQAGYMIRNIRKVTRTEDNEDVIS